MKLDEILTPKTKPHGRVQGQDLLSALNLKWRASRVDHLVVKYESEWGGKMTKWDALDPFMHDGLPYWTTEKERIKQLQMWDACKEALKPVSTPSVYHLHPVGIVGNFIEGATCIPLPKAQLLALTVSSGFEGNKPMDFAATADNFDGMGMSYGVIQWNAASGTLAPVLSAMRSADPTSFKAAFPASSNYNTLDSALTSGNSKDLYNWALKQQATNPSGWQVPFQNLAQIQAFKDIQIATAVRERHQYVMVMIEFLRHLSPDLMKNVELVSYCALFDLAIQQQSLAPASACRSYDGQDQVR